MSEQITISFVGNTKLKSLLVKWAKQDDRSVSYIVRKILEKEAQQREVNLESKTEKGLQVR